MTGAERVDLFRRMALIRRFEDRVYQLFLEGEIPGTLHQCQGQEAVAVGVTAHLARDDWVTSTHRPHGHAIAARVAKATGCCGGKGGSMHLGDPAVGMLPAIAIVAGGNSVVSGMGLAFKLRRTNQVAVCFFGEGATNEGAFHEGLNLAAVKQLPIVYVCENNIYGASTPFSRASLVEHVADRGAAYGVPGEVVDGMDVMAVHAAAGAAIERARGGEGPQLLECKTYRFTGHSRNDARGYRSREEEAAWRARDPIVRLRESLVAEGLAADVEAAEGDVDSEIADAVEFARQSPEPPPEAALSDVYASPLPVAGREIAR